MIQAWPPIGVPGSESPTLSLCATWRWDCVVHLPAGNRLIDGADHQSPYSIGCRVMDYPEHQIMLMFAPTVGLLKASQRAGMTGSWRRNVPGLKEALERSRVKKVKA